MEYKSNLNKVTSELEKAQITALKKIGLLVQAESQDNAPVDSGRLKQSITNQVNEDEKSVDIGTNVDYAVYVHEGNSKQSSKPFIKDAIIKNIDKIKQIAGGEVSTSMNKE
jgi:HK97 gp10 family phage protein